MSTQVSYRIDMMKDVEDIIKKNRFDIKIKI